MGTTLHTLKPPAGARRAKTRVGRGIGSGKGKTSTRGMKGQHARNNSMPASFEGGQMPIHRRVPKRGFTNIWRTEVHGVNLGRIDGAFAANEDVTIEALRAKGLLPKRANIIKILGTGDVSKALKITAHRVSASAKAKVEKAGGSIELLPVQPRGPKPKADEASA